jgi:putative cell wall-binding protein
MGRATLGHGDSGAARWAHARRCVLRPTLLMALVSSVAAVSAVVPVAGPSTNSRHRPNTKIPRTPVPPPATDNSSWSGELAWASKNGAASFDHVTGAWVQPGVVGSSSAQYADTWVGVDGYDGKLLQTGTTAWTEGGAVSYEAWFVAWTGNSSGMTVIDEPVAPGDHVQVAIDRNSSGTWSAELEDTTAGWQWSTTVTYPANGSTAEWIEEAPGTWSTPSHYQTLADYGSATFTTVRANGIPPATVTTLDIVQNGAVISYASTYLPGRGSFSVRYGQPEPAASSTTQAPGPTVASRIYGATPDATAAAELEHQFTYGSDDCPGTTGSRPVVLATDAAYADALSSAYLASYLQTGTLLTQSNFLPSPTLTAIRKEGITKVYVVGGDLAVSTAVVEQLESAVADTCGGASALPGTVKISVTRIAGTTEYDTAEEIAETPPATYVGAISVCGAYASSDGSGGLGAYNDTAGLASSTPDSATALPTAIVATGKSFQDAESSGTLAYAERLPTLLTTPNALSPQVSSAIQALAIKQVIVMGGQDAVSDAVVSALEGLGVSVLRIAGQTYSATSVELARFELATASGGDGLGWKGTGSVILARGNGYTDGLAGAAIAAGGPSMTAPEPLLLTLSPTSIGAGLVELLHTAGTTGMGGERVTHFTILGGPLAITQATVDSIDADL